VALFRKVRRPSSEIVHSRKDGIIFEMKIVVVVGTRPNFIKAAPILKAIREFNGMRGQWAGTIQPILVHTGQHYDAKIV